MIGKTTHPVTVAGRKVELSHSDYRRIQAMLKRGNKLEAVGILRNYSRARLASVKAAVEDPHNFDPADRPAIDRAEPGFINDLKTILAGDLSVRQWLATHPSPVLVVVILTFCLSLAIGVNAAWDSPARPTHEVWYYDLSSDELFAAEAQTPPIDAPSRQLVDNQPAGVLAHVFSCGQCTDDERYIGYLEKFTPDALIVKKQLATGQRINKQSAWFSLAIGHVVRSPDGGDWVPLLSEEGQKIVKHAMSRCETGRPVPCRPIHSD